MLRRRRKDEASPPDQGAEVFEGLWGQVLAVDPVTVGLAPDRDRPNVFCVVMDMTYPNGTATVVALADGTTSLYTNTGGGVVGGGAHANVVQANRALLLEDQVDDGYTALMYAANAGHEAVVEALLDHGANPNAVDHQKSTPLMFASQHDHLGIVRKLLAAGADPKPRGDHGLTALGSRNRTGTSAPLLSS